MDDFCDRARRAYEDSKLSSELRRAIVLVRSSKRAFRLARKRVAETKICKSVTPKAYFVSLENWKDAETRLTDAEAYKKFINEKYEALWR